MAGNATDTRIVQMQFDNKDFEKNIAQSEKSLDKFKESLNFEECEDSLNDFEAATKRLTFDSMAQNLQKLTDKFTGLGTMSELVLSQIRHGIERTAAQVSSFVDSMTTQQIYAGQSKYEMLNKSVQTIKASTGLDEKTVYGVMQRLNNYTDQTSYNFADMAQNIGKFTSVGIDLNTAERQMEGIANWAARSGAGINEASRAMYNLSQAMGVGQLQLIDWKSIENAGMATKEFKEQLIQAGVAAGTLVKQVNNKTGKEVIMTAKSLGKQIEVNYQNVGSTLQKRWATRDVLGSTLEGYYWDDLYYEGTQALLNLDAAKQEIFDKMFEDDEKLSGNEWKTLSTMGVITEDIKQKIVDLAVQQHRLTKEVSKDGKTIYKTVNKTGKQIEFSLESIEQSFQVGWFDKSFGKNITSLNDLAKSSYEAAQKCLTFSDVLGAWKDQLSTGWMNSFKHIFGELSESMELFSNICNKVGNALDRLISFRNGVLEAWGGNGGRDSLWSLIVGEVTDPETGETIAYKNAYGLLDVLGTIGELVTNAFWEIMKLFAGDDVTANWEKDPEYRKGWMAAKIQATIDNVHNFIKAIREFFNSVPDGGTKTRFQMIQDVVTGALSVVTIAYTAIRDIIGFIGGVAKLLEPSAYAILRVLDALAGGLYETAGAAVEGKGLKAIFDQLLVTIKPLTDAINGLVTIIADLLIKFIETGKKNGTFTKIWKSLSEIINAVAKIISKVGPPILDFIGSLLTIISDLFENGINSDSLKAAGGQLEKAIEKLFSDIFGLIPGIGKQVEEFIAYIFGFAENDASIEADGSSKTILGVTKQWLRKIFGGFADLFDGFKREGGELSLFGLIKESWGLGLLGNFLSGLRKLLASANLYKLIKMFGGIFLLFKAIKIARQTSGILTNVKGFMTGLADTLQNGVKLKIGDQLESTGDKVLKIAKAIALMAASVAVLGSMTPSSLVKGIIALGAILAAMFAFLLIMKKYIVKDFKEAMGMVGTIGAIGASIFAMMLGIVFLVNALKPLAKMKPDQVMNMLTGLFGILTILGLFVTYIKTVKIEGTKQLAALAFGIALLIFALRPLANMNLEQMLMMGFGLMGVLGILGEFSQKMGSVKTEGTKELIALAVGIAIMMFALLPVAQMDLGQVGTMLLTLAGILFILGTFTNKVGFMKGSGMMNLVAVAAAIWLLLEAVKPLADFRWEQLGKIGASIAGIMFILAMFINHTQSMKWTGMLEMVAVAAAIWILVKSVEPLAKYEWGDLAKMGAALVVLAGVVAGFTHLVKQSNLIKGGGTAVMLIALAVVIAAFGFAMGAAAEAKWENILVACIGLLAVLTVFSKITENMMKETDIFSAIHVLIAMAGLAAVILAFSMGLNEIKNVPTDKILVFAVGLAAMLAAFGFAMSMVKDISLMGAIKGIAVIAAGMAALMGVLALMAPLVVGSIGNSIEKMSAKLSIAAGMFENFTHTMRNITEDDIASARRKYDALFDLIKSLQDVRSYLPAISQFSGAMLSLGTGLWNFNYATKDIPDPESMPGIKLMNTLLNSKDKLTGFTIGNAATEIFGLGTGLMLFEEATKDITTDQPMGLKLLQGLAGEANNLKTLTELPLETFKANIAGLGGALTLYGMGAKEVASTEIGKPTDITAAIDLLNRITTALNENDEGFVLPNLPAQSELSGFGADLAALAGALIKFQNASQGLTDTSKGIYVLQFLADLKENLTDENIKLANVFGAANVNVGSLVTFGIEIAALGVALKNYADKTKDFTSNQNALDALVFFSNLKDHLTAEKLSTIYAFEKNGISQQTLQEFGTDISELGMALSGFATNVNFDEEKQKKFGLAIKSLDDLVAIGNRLPRIGGLVSVFEGSTQTLGDLGDNITILGQGLSGFSKALTGEGGDGIANFDIELVRSAMSIVQTISGITVMLSQLDSQGLGQVGGYMDELANIIWRLYNTTNMQGMTMVESVAGFMVSFKDAVQKAGGLGDTTIFDSLVNTATAVSNLMKLDPSLDFSTVGLNISNGLKLGIEQGRSRVVNAAILTVRQAILAARKEAQINSPSKVFAQMGEYMSIGLANGLISAAGQPEQASAEMVSDMVNNARLALNNLSLLLTEGISGDPTITPVLDLSNIEAGVPVLNSMLGGQYGIGIDPTAGKVRAGRALPVDVSGSQVQTRADMTSLFNRIDVMSQRITELGTRISQMKLVLDSGVVAGGVTDPVDVNLGRKMLYAERRN